MTLEEEKKYLPLILEIEGLLIDLSEKQRNDEGWSSRLEAEKLLTLISETLEGKRAPLDTKPWTRYAIGPL